MLSAYVVVTSTAAVSVSGVDESVPWIPCADPDERDMPSIARVLLTRGEYSNWQLGCLALRRRLRYPTVLPGA
jgi:hypothetical protein